jgi:NADH dehydrogenase
MFQPLLYQVATAALAPNTKTLSDALAIRQQILCAFEAAEVRDDPNERRRLLNFVLIGAGPTGVELAGAIAELAKASHCGPGPRDPTTRGLATDVIPAVAGPIAQATVRPSPG